MDHESGRHRRLFVQLLPTHNATHKGFHLKGPLRKANVVIFTPCGDICGGCHHKSKSPQVIVAILFVVGSNVRELYESIAGRANMFNSMCTWYIECNRGTFSDRENADQKGRNDTRIISKKEVDAI